MLHFGAVDYDATVWVNGEEVGRHRGGFTPFSCSLFDLARAGEEIEICVRARDDNQTPKPRGKQSQRFENYECLYTRTTGIWADGVDGAGAQNLSVASAHHARSRAGPLPPRTARATRPRPAFKSAPL